MPVTRPYVDPEFEPLVAAAAYDPKTLAPETVAGIRAVATPRLDPPSHGTERAELLVGARRVKVRIHRPAAADGRPQPCLVWLHSGGHVLDNFAGGARILDRWSAEARCVVVVPAYSLSPERPYPAALDDCLDVLAWLAAAAGELSVDVARLALGGVSAGGGLAAGVALANRDLGPDGVRFRGLFLQYPMLDDRGGTASSAWEDAPIWPPAANRYGWRAYLSDVQGEVPAYAAPARAADLAGLPPALLTIGTSDIFLDEVTGFARRLVDARVPVDLRVYAGAPHGFVTLGPHTRPGGAAIRDASAWLKARLAVTIEGS